MGSAPPDTPPVSQGSSTAMVARITLLVCIIQIVIGLQVEEDQQDKLEKVLEDTIQNTELDGDIVDFPAWSSSGEDISEKTDQRTDFYQNGKAAVVGNEKENYLVL